MIHSLEDKSTDVYCNIDNTVIKLKTAFIGLCSDIDRYFKYNLNIDLHNKIDSIDFKNVYYSFYNLSKLTIEQFNSLILLFVNIRSVNSHLYLNKPVIIDEDLELYLRKICQPRYEISKGRELTIYGYFYILCFLSNKSMIWPFCTSFFKPEFFTEIEIDSMSTFQVDMEHYAQIYCGQGVPVVHFNAENKYGRNEIIYLNDLCKKTLINIFFDFEISCMKGRKKSIYNPPSLRKMLQTNIPNYIANKNEIINDIYDLRNVFFHGNLLFEKVTTIDKEFIFSVDYILSTLYKIKTTFLRNKKFQKILYNISLFGNSLINYYCLRFVELSYKVIDNRLNINEDKLIERVKNLNNSFERIISNDKSFYDSIFKLNNEKVYNLKVNKSKFTDKLERNIVSTKFKIYKIVSDSNIIIGNFNTGKNVIYIADLPLDKEFQNKINNKYLNEFDVNNKTDYSDLFTLIETNI